MSTKVVGHSCVVRRKPSYEQGRALEILGHAIEYLLDSYVLTQSSDRNPGDHEAAQILMGLSRAIFLECPQIIPLTTRLRRLLHTLFRFSGKNETSKHASPSPEPEQSRTMTQSCATGPSLGNRASARFPFSDRPERK